MAYTDLRVVLIPNAVYGLYFQMYSDTIVTVVSANYDQITTEK